MRTLQLIGGHERKLPDFCIFRRGIDSATRDYRFNLFKPMNSNPKSTTTPNDHCIDICNGLLRGELSAVETYGQAIDKYAGSPVTEELRRIRADHSRSANWLSANVREMGGVPQKDSGAWGLFANAVQGAANLFGENSFGF